MMRQDWMTYEIRESQELYPVIHPLGYDGHSRMSCFRKTNNALKTTKVLIAISTTFGFHLTIKTIQSLHPDYRRTARYRGTIPIVWYCTIHRTVTCESLRNKDVNLTQNLNHNINFLTRTGKRCRNHKNAK